MEMRFSRSFSHLLSAAAILCWTLRAGPAWGSGGEHPEHPENKKPAEKKQSAVQLEDVARFIEDHVKKGSQDGTFQVQDAEAKKALSLTLDRVHRERLSQVGQDMFFVCCDFKTADGKVYDLDFFVQGKSKESLKVLPKETSIHKENGKERYAWSFDKEKGVWVKRAR